MSRVLKKYLANYAEPTALRVAAIQGHWQRVVLIPAYDEPVEKVWRIWQSLAQADCLIILVINQAETEQGNGRNQHCARFFSEQLKETWTCSTRQLRLLSAATGHSNAALLIVDCYSNGWRLPAEHGVGLARKIGADIACALYQQSAVERAWIFSTDADVRLPPDYLTSTDSVSRSTSMVLLPFTHLPSDEPTLNRAQMLYDFHLQYYVEGLRWAKSPYAFHTMGSAQIINMEHYAAVRGFPKRNAGEDFYLLNKLLKTGKVVEREHPEIAIQTRRSARTPFGTGVAVSKIEAELKQGVQPAFFYHPMCFAELRETLAGLEECWQKEPTSNAECAEVLAELGFENAVEKARNNSRSQTAFVRHMHNWFDAFRTMKFVHLARDKHYPSLSVQELGPLLPDDLQPAPTLRHELMKPYSE